MIVDQEKACIKAAQAVRWSMMHNTFAKRREKIIESYDLKPWFPAMPDSEMAPRIKLARFFFTPVFVAGVIVMVIAAPLVFIGWALWYGYEAIRFIWQQRRELRHLRAGAIELPQEKTLENLWHLHGIAIDYENEDDCEALLRAWLVCLYGETCARQVDTEARKAAILKERSESRAQLGAGFGGGCIFFEPLFECLLRELSNELPEYGKMAR